MITLTTQTQTLYAELLERLVAEAARKSAGRAPGAVVHKTIRGETYAYFQFSEPGGRHRQVYLGKAGDKIQRFADRFNRERQESRRAREEVERLSAQAALGGAWQMGSGPARVLRAFSEAGVFERGTVLVGTHAFGVLGNLLGARWAGVGLRTDDVDLAAISIAAASEEGAVDAPSALKRLEMGFLPVPALDPRRASTSFSVRGSALRVDFLTSGRGEGPVALPLLGTHAQPLALVDYLIEGPSRAAVIDGGGFLVLVPAPARFALHKLIVAARRPHTEQTKVAKDLEQAAEILVFLAETRPGDLRLGADALRKRHGWTEAMASLRAVARRRPDVSPALRLLAPRR